MDYIIFGILKDVMGGCNRFPTLFEASNSPLLLHLVSWILVSLLIKFLLSRNRFTSAPSLKFTTRAISLSIRPLPLLGCSKYKEKQLAQMQ